MSAAPLVDRLADRPVVYRSRATGSWIAAVPATRWRARDWEAFDTWREAVDAVGDWHRSGDKVLRHQPEVRWT